MTGSSIGAAHVGESATAAVVTPSADAAAGPAGLREFGAGAGGRAFAIGDSSGSQRSVGATASPADAEDSVAATRARKEADRTAVDRSALFAKPSGRTATAAGKAPAPAAAADGYDDDNGDKQRSGAGDARGAAGRAEDGADDYDYERAFADMQADADPSEVSDTAKVTLPQEDEDLGIL